MNQIPQNPFKINILVAADHGGYKGKLAGVGRYLSYTLPHIDQTRFNVILVILRDGGSVSGRLEGTGIKVFKLQRKKFDFFTLKDFLTIIKTENVHLLHLHQYACSNFGRIAGKLKNVPTIVHCHDLNYDYPWYQRLSDRILKNITQYAVAVSESVKASCVRTRAMDPEKIIVIPNGIPSESMKHLNREKCQAIKLRLGLKKDYKIVGTITRMHAVKGNDVLLKAAHIVLQTLPDTYFVFAGDGPLMENLKDLARNLGIWRNVFFIGFQKDVAGILSIFDIKVIASDSEGCSLALLEAMALGKALVATQMGGIKEIVSQGVSAELVSPQNPEAMADKIISLLQNKNIREKLGSNAYKEAGKYTLRSHIRMLEKFYEDAAGININ